MRSQLRVVAGASEFLLRIIILIISTLIFLGWAGVLKTWCGNAMACGLISMLPLLPFRMQVPPLLLIYSALMIILWGLRFFNKAPRQMLVALDSLAVLSGVYLQGIALTRHSITCQVCLAILVLISVVLLLSPHEPFDIREPSSRARKSYSVLNLASVCVGFIVLCWGLYEGGGSAKVNRKSAVSAREISRSSSHSESKYVVFVDFYCGSCRVKLFQYNFIDPRKKSGIEFRYVTFMDPFRSKKMARLAALSELKGLSDVFFSCFDNFHEIDVKDVALKLEKSGVSIADLDNALQGDNQQVEAILASDERALMQAGLKAVPQIFEINGNVTVTNQFL